MLRKSIIYLVFAMLVSVSSFAQDADSTRIRARMAHAQKLESEKKYEEAETLLDSLMANINPEKNTRLFINSILNKTIFLERTRRFDEAEKLSEKANQEINSRLTRPHEFYGWIQLIKGDIIYRQGKLVESIPFYEEAIVEYEPLTSREAYQKMGAINNVLGINYARRAYYDLAAEYFNKADDYFSNYVKDPQEVWRVKNNLGNLNLLQGHYQKAIAYYDESVSMKRKYLGDEHPSLITTYNNISNLYSELDNHNLALEYEEFAYRIAEKNEFETVEQRIFRHTSMALLLIELKRFSEAEDQLRKAEAAIATASTPLPALRSDLNFQWAFLYVSQEKNELAIEYYLKAYDYSKKQNNLTDKTYPKSISGLASVYVNLKQYDKAIKAYDESIDVFKKIYKGPHQDFVETFKSKASVLIKQKRFEEALNNLDMALDYIDGFSRDDETNFENVQDKRLVLIILAEMAYALRERYLIEKNPADAIESNRFRKLCDSIVQEVQENGTYEDRLRMLATIDILYENGVAVSHLLYHLDKEIANLDEALYFAERGKNVLLRKQLNESRQKKFGTIPDELLILEQDLKGDISYAKSQLYTLSKITDSNQRDTAKIDFYQSRLFTKQRTLDSLKQQFENDFPTYFNTVYNNKYFTSDEIQDLLDAKSQLIQYVESPDNFYLISITKNKNQFLRIEKNEKLENELGQYLSLLYDPTSDIDAIHKLGSHLYSVLLDPLGTLKESLIIVPDGQLNLLPFETLSSTEISSATQPYLLANHQISYLNATEELFSAKRKSPSSKINLLAMASSYTNASIQAEPDTVRSGLGALRWTVEEAKMLADTYNGELFLDADATEENFRKSIGGKNVIHIASHGLVDHSTPLYSRLVLEKDLSDTINDGNLFIHELYNMSLDAEMVVLSACNTAAGQVTGGEGVLNIGRGFFYAGVPSVVMSHWQVDDQSTSVLMKYFYEYLSQGMKKSEALREAKLKFIAEASPNKKHPFYWGAFIAMGDDSPVVRKGPGLLTIVMLALMVLLALFLIARRRSASTS